jgi:hypothetical protein
MAAGKVWVIRERLGEWLGLWRDEFGARPRRGFVLRSARTGKEGEMTIQLDLPQDLERAVRRRAEASGREVGPWLVGFLEETVMVNDERIPRLEPSAYPDEGIGDEVDYRPVVFPVVGTAKVRFVADGRLTPPSYPEQGR